jgi:hypothetical protein
MRISIIITILFLFSTTASARYKYAAYLLSTASTIYDARAHALGRCEIMGANGSNSIFYNPAHIASQEGSQIQVSGYTRFYEATLTKWDNQSLSKKRIAELAQFSYSNFYGEINDKIKMSYGIGINKFLDFTIDEKYTRYNENGDHKVEENEKVSGGLYCLTPSVAFNIKDVFLIGLTLNKSIFGNRYKYSKGHYINDPDFMYFYHSNGKGINTTFITMGAIIPISPSMTLGVKYRGGMKLKYGDGTFRTTSPDGTTTVNKTKGGETTLSSSLGLSAAYSPSNHTTFLCEYRKQSWFDLRGSHFGYGVELKVNSIPIRIGGFSDNIPKLNLSGKGITYGTGIGFGRFRLDLSGERIFVEETIYTRQMREFKDDKVTNYSFNLNLSYFPK